MQKIARGEYLTSLIGTLSTDEEIARACQTGQISCDDPLQIEEQLYLILNPTVSKLNHSCSPNAGIRHSHHLYAFKDIKVDEEITFDYSTTVGINNEWLLSCHCSTTTCRKKIGNVLTIPLAALEEYFAADLLPAFIKKQLRSPSGYLITEASHIALQGYVERLIKTARSLKLPIEYDSNLFWLTVVLSGRKYKFHAGQTPFNDEASSALATNKYCSSKLLREAGFPVPESLTIDKESYFAGDWQLPCFDFPMVAKPTISHYGNGRDVLCNIKDQQTLLEYMEANFKKHELITLEKFEADLRCYRVTIFFKKIVGVTLHEPPTLIGDGKHSIKELMKLENERRAHDQAADLAELMVDYESEMILNELKLHWDSIPEEGEKIILAYTCNTSRGASSTSLGTAICPKNAALLIKAAQLLNLNLVGFDVICEDIRTPIENSRGFIIEANSSPDIYLHEAPSAGPSMALASLLFRRLIYKHPFSYLNNLLQQSLPYPGVLYRALFTLGLVLGLVEWMRNF